MDSPDGMNMSKLAPRDGSNPVLMPNFLLLDGRVSRWILPPLPTRNEDLPASLRRLFYHGYLHKEYGPGFAMYTRGNIGGDFENFVAARGGKA